MSPTFILKRCFATTGDIIPIKVPSMGDSVSEGTIQSLQKNVGDYVDALEAVVVIETDKITVDIPAGVCGIIESFNIKAGDIVTVQVDSPIFKIKVTEPQAPVKESTPEKAPVKESTPEKASEKKEEPKKVPSETKVPTKTAPAPQQIPNMKSVTGPATGPPQPGRPELVVKMSRLRQKVAQRLKESQNTCACLTTFQEVNMGPLIEMRNQYKDSFFDKHKVKLGFMSAFVKASCAAIEEVPGVNAVIENDNIIYHQYVDMSIAVGTPTGLMVPVIRNANTLSFAEIERAIAQLADKARKGTISIEDMTGGTFTISNGGVYGSLFGTPIINPPQSAILGMHGTKIRPVVENGQIVARPMMYMALTYDHRLVDGSEAVTYLCKLRDKIEDPKRLLLEL